MKRINLLDINTSNKIAAGEVVERPSSVVKELLENSIDADSKNIIVEFENGGESLIKVVDDGHGIHPEDVEKAFMPHATSKINSVEDIYSINTLGFRGEALPSIAAVSKIHLKSKSSNYPFGKEIIVEGGSVRAVNQVGMAQGTHIEVRDLFFNVPARKKFMKSSSRESALINEIVSRIAISAPDVSIKLFSNGKKVFHTYGNDNLLDAIRIIHGKNIVENLVYFENHSDVISVYGYIGTEDISRGSRSNQIIFVNKRFIKNKLVTAAAENAFKSFSTVNKYPFFIIFIDLYPEFVDVNIHPTKSEIKFKDERSLYKVVFDAVHNALKKRVFDSFTLPEEIKKESDSIEEITFNFSAPHVKEPNNAKIYDKEEIAPKIDNTFFVNDKGNNYNGNEVFSNDKKIEVALPVDLKSVNTETIFDKELASQDGKSPNIDIPVAKFPNLRIIGQFNKTYIIGEYEDTLYLIDQHAAHEKILFEKYLKDIENSQIVVQPLLVPCIIDLSTDDISYYEENNEIFKKAGFSIECFGGNTINLKEIPYFLGKLNPRNLFLDIIDNLKNLGTGKTTEVKYNRIATMACKAAVKANDFLTENEMQKLVEDLRYINDPFHCPHGRPTIIKFTLNELEKKFRRIQ
ncbi:DNA mismatch repair protein MutL [Clostridium polyendosporum]|uniref:DNA mismatch repair protein MutL n=1 Tax=Clostridium polyendosporum TaxID=69208 RepID=A0A919S379_9CLOT|nr:DNA mismatch repair endonuclease MutL [Clostridium polyendosporum]GIM30649.1 DNA mismatch repair protein MutL [Clostridium polyendosporum]